MSTTRRCTFALCLVLSLAICPFALRAQDESPDPPAKETPAASQAESASERSLREEQQALRMRFVRFEETLAKMARYLQKTEPARAELILRALSRSKAERVGERMMLTSRLLSKSDGDAPQFADAIAEQEAILARLREILKILRSEDILDENKREQKRLEELAKQINVLIDAEKINRAKTDRGEPTDRAAESQRRTADRTGEIIADVKAHDAKSEEGEKGRKGEGEKESGGDEGSEEKEKKSGDSSKKGEAGESKETDSDSQKSGKSDGKQKSSESSEKDSEKSPMGGEGNKKSGDSKSESESSKAPMGGESPMGESSEKSPSNSPPKGSQSPPAQGQPPQGGQQSQQSQQSQQTPGRQELEAARQRMQQAIEQLQEQNRKHASKEQEEAIQKLIEAKERIEERLRQLREEERELLLRALEARFQKMHQLQQVVLAATEGLNKTGKEKWQDRDYAQCRDAAATEREIGIEADKALEILRADASSVAFPLAVQQIRNDVGEVARRLGEEDAGQLTIVIEKEILLALEEMIAALQKEMKEMREKKKQKSGQQQGQPQEPGLVDQIAELKMLKTLQVRINRRTRTLGELFEGEQATKPDIIAQLQELSARQGRLQRATYDLSIGKTAK